LAAITGPLGIAKPYTNQIMVLEITINIIQILKSPTLFAFHDLYTCGKKVMALKKDPM